MAHKITYYLGAGASAQCLPVVNQMAEDLKTTVQLFHNSYIQNIEKTADNIKLKNSIIADLEWLAEICRTHYNVDTYAKKLFLSKNTSEYLRLNRVLSVYFTIQQKLKIPDKRYDNFWASILSSTAHLPNNLRIISWNYDSQLELSYKNFANSNGLADAYSSLGMSCFHNNSDDIYTKTFGIFKLNGSAKIVQNALNSSYLVDDMDSDFRIFFKSLLNSYEMLKQLEAKKNDANELSFAWEHDLNSSYYQKLKESITDTTVLVVIGYSFPYFNRMVDKLIINECMPALHTVYIQAPNAENLRERFLSMNNMASNIYLRRDEDQFTFPNELDI